MISLQSMDIYILSICGCLCRALHMVCKGGQIQYMDSAEHLQAQLH